MQLCSKHNPLGTGYAKKMEFISVWKNRKKSLKIFSKKDTNENVCGNTIGKYLNLLLL